MTYWHYTSAWHILSIISDGVVKPADEGKGDSQMVWLSSNPVWEVASSTNMGGLGVLNVRQMAILCGGVFRIAVDSDRFLIHKWPAVLEVCPSMPARYYETQLMAASLWGSKHGDWGVSLKPIPDDFWRGIDYWHDGAWIALEQEDILPLLHRILNPEVKEIFDLLDVSNRARWINMLRVAAARDDFFNTAVSRDHGAEIIHAVNPAMKWIETRTSGADPNEKLAAIFDVDETSLSNLPNINRRAIQPVLNLYDLAKSKGVAPIFITDRRELLRDDTARDLSNAGYSGWNSLQMRPQGNTDPTEIMKSGLRQSIERMGYRIILNIGDQQSDLDGGYSERTYKIPNPWE